MKTKYKFIGVSEYGHKYLCVEDIEQLTEMIGCEVEESEKHSTFDGEKMFIMPDGEETHIKFLEIEEIQAQIPFEND